MRYDQRNIGLLDLRLNTPEKGEVIYLGEAPKFPLRVSGEGLRWSKERLLTRHHSLQSHQILGRRKRRGWQEVKRASALASPTAGHLPL